jgi:cytochrome b6-f complex iron-sulfur subunit
MVLVQPESVSRREFLYYAWGASMALALAGSGGAVLWFATPKFREGEFGGEFVLAPGKIPGTDAPPEDHAQGRFWLINTNEGLLAVYKVCTHLGCLYKWVPSHTRFECPCHGSKFSREGQYLEGPAPRHLDRFAIRVVDAAGSVLAETLQGDANTDPAVGQPLAIPPGAAEVRILTGRRIKGARR